jgi:hypothetical protein
VSGGGSGSGAVRALPGCCCGSPAALARLVRWPATAPPPQSRSGSARAGPAALACSGEGCCRRAPCWPRHPSCAHRHPAGSARLSASRHTCERSSAPLQGCRAWRPARAASWEARATGSWVPEPAPAVAAAEALLHQPLAARPARVALQPSRAAPLLWPVCHLLSLRCPLQAFTSRQQASLRKREELAAQKVGSGQQRGCCFWAWALLPGLAWLRSPKSSDPGPKPPLAVSILLAASL